MDHRKRNKKILFFIVTALFCAVNSSYAIDMPRIDKSKIRLYIKPGHSQEGEININNPSDGAMSLRSYVQDWYYSAGDGGKEFVPPGTTIHSCASWISFSPQDFILAPESSQKIKYSVRVPEGASGAYYAVLFFENMLARPQAIDSKQTVGVNLAVRFATLFYIQVDGTLETRGELENIFLKKAATYAPLLINADFKNTGNADITMSGVFAIMDKTGNVLGRGTISSVYTLPGDKAKLKGIWREALGPGDYNFILTLDLGKAGHKGEFEKGPYIIKEIEMRIAQDGSLTDFQVIKE
jgi:hypothetical protein